MTLIVNGFLGSLLLTGGLGSAEVVAFVVYVDPRAVQVVANSSDNDPFGVDPRAVQMLAKSSDADPYGVDPRAVQLVVASSDGDPYGVDPRAVQLVQ